MKTTPQEKVRVVHGCQSCKLWWREEGFPICVLDHEAEITEENIELDTAPHLCPLRENDWRFSYCEGKTNED